jgi:polar amino acid transport system permease protein
MDGLQNIIDTFFDLEVMGKTFPKLLTVGLPNTLLLTVLAGAIGILLGNVIAMGLMSSKRVLRVPCRIYVDILRGLPHILIVYLIGQGLPLSGIKIFGDNTYGYAALAIGLMEAAYMAEIFRSGFQSVENGLIEASRSLGVSHLKTLLKVVIPLGTRRVLPALTGQFILIIKGTSLVYVLGLMPNQRDLFAFAQDDSLNQANLSPLVAAGLVFLALTIPMTYAVNAWQRKLETGKAVSQLPAPEMQEA